MATMSKGPMLFNQAIRGGIASSAGDTTLKIISFLSTALVLSHIAPYQFGIWQLLLSILTAFSLPLFPSVGGMLIADASREIGGGKNKIANGILVKAGIVVSGMGAVLATLMFLAAPLVTEITNFQMTELLRILSFALLFNGVAQLYPLILRTRLEFFHVQFNRAIGRISYLIALLLFVVVLELDIMGLAYAFLAASIVPVVAYFPYIARLYVSMARNMEGNWRIFFDAIFKRGIWVIATDCIKAIIGACMPWVIGLYLGVPVIGLITIAQTLLSHVSSAVPVSFVLRSVLPRTVHDTERLRVWLTRSMKYSVWLHLVAGVLGLSAFAVLAPVFFPAYVAAIPLCAMLMPSIIFRGPGVVASEWFYSSHNQKDFFLWSTLPGFVAFLFLAPMLYLLGLPGYVLNTYLAADILLVFRLWTIRRKTGIRISFREFIRVDAQDADVVRRVIELFLNRVRTVLSR